MEIKRTALVYYTPEQMYRLVNDVEAYPEFLPWCSRAKRLQGDEHQLTASIEISKGPVRKTFSTRNQMIPGEQITLRLVEGPFKYLEGQWRFQPLGDSACKILLDMRFEFSNRILSATVGPVFSQICGSLVDSFCKRADQLYKGKS